MSSAMYISNEYKINSRRRLYRLLFSALAVSVVIGLQFFIQEDVVNVSALASERLEHLASFFTANQVTVSLVIILIIAVVMGLFEMTIDKWPDYQKPVKKDNVQEIGREDGEKMYISYRAPAKTEELTSKRNFKQVHFHNQTS